MSSSVVEDPVKGSVVEDPVKGSVVEGPRLRPQADGLDVRAARSTLRGQIARLERQLASLVVELGQAGRSVPLPPHPTPGPGRPRVLSLGELETVRDSLLSRLQAAQHTLGDRERAEASARARLEAMLEHPTAHRSEVIARADLGEAGCGAYRVRPRLGLLGMLFDWWCVKLSSGCP